MIEVRVEEDFDEDDEGQLSHSHGKSVHSRLQPAESVFEEDLENQFEESPMGKLYLIIISKQAMSEWPDQTWLLHVTWPNLAVKLIISALQREKKEENGHHLVKECYAYYKQNE